MSDECRNDCVKPPRFPRNIHNRPGLTHIDYRIGTYADFRQALIHRLNQDPVLARWTHRQPDDPGVALLEGAAILGDILTFYQELYANEAYLGTAQWRESIADLVRLTGYRLSPGLAGKAAFAVEVKGDKPVTIPKGFRFKAQLEGMDKPAEFETSSDHVAYPELSKFNLYCPSESSELGKGTNMFSVKTREIEQAGIFLSPGDRLMLINIPGGSIRQISKIVSIGTRFNQTEIAIAGGWHGSVIGNELTAYKLGRSFRHFGYNAPPKEIVISGSVADQSNVDFGKVLGELIPIDQVVDDLSPGTIMLICLCLYDEPPAIGSIPQFGSPGYKYYNEFFESEVTQVSSISATMGSMTGGTSLVELSDRIEVPIHGGADFKYTDIRTVELHEVIGEKFTVRGILKPKPESDCSRLGFYSNFETYTRLKDRRVMLTLGDNFAQSTTTINESIPDDNRQRLRYVRISPVPKHITIDDFPLDDPLVTVYGNLITTTQGKTETEAVLGSGDRRQVFQTFKLPKKPLTYFRCEEEDPPETPELSVYVNDRLWPCVPTFFDRGPNEQVYIVRQDEAGDIWVQFGDGKTGARLPSGLDNVSAVYRTGSGAAGPLKEGATARAGKRLEGLRKVHLPGEAFGGANRESGENAKAAAPGKLQSLGRLVTLQDIECEARALPGVVKAAARWDIHVGGAAVVVTLLTQNGPTLTERRELEAILNQANQDRGTRRFPIVVRPGVRHYIYLSVSIGYNSTYKEVLVKEAVKIALGLTGEEEFGIDGGNGLFGIKQRCFGQPEYATRIEGTIQQVKGVVWARVVSIGFLVDDASNPAEWEERAPLAVSTIIRSDCERDEAPEQVLLTLHSPHLRMAFSPIEPTEVGCHG